MTEDVETILAGLEARLRALQSELDDAPDEPPGSDPSPHEYPGSDPEPVDPQPLEEFGRELRRLVRSYDRVIASARGLTGGEGILFRDDVALDARADLGGLCALDRALAAIPGVASVDLRAYAGGSAALDLVLDRAVPLVSELRRTLRRSLSVVEAREGRLAIEVGTVHPDGPGSRATT